MSLLAVLVSTMSNSQVFLLKKNVSSFCRCKSYSHFFSKNISIYAIFRDQSFNGTLTNNIVSFEQLGQVFLKKKVSKAKKKKKKKHKKKQNKNNLFLRHHGICQNDSAYAIFSRWEFFFFQLMKRYNTRVFLIFNQIKIQTTNTWYSYLKRISVNYHLFILFETGNFHFKNVFLLFFLAPSFCFCQTNQNVQECTQLENKKSHPHTLFFFRK